MPPARPPRSEPPDPASSPSLRDRISAAAGVFGQVPGTFALVWEADRRGTVAIGALTALLALLPAPVAWVGKLIVDAVVASSRSADPTAPGRVTRLVLVELGLLATTLVAGRLLGLARELLRAHLSNRVNVRILEKSLSLDLRHFEDPEVHDKLQNARREASARPLSLVMQSFGVAQGTVTLAALSALLWRLSPWSVLVILVASVPAFVAEARLSAASFRVNTWRAPEGRRLNYLEWMLTRDSHAKEVKLFDLGPLVLGRYRGLFERFYDEDRRLAVRRLLAGTGFGLLSLAAFYAMYLLVADRAARGGISLGDMTLYLVVFRQGQQAFQGILAAVGGMYEDALYMSNLFAFLAIPTSADVPRPGPPARLPRGAPLPVAFEGVSFRYPGQGDWALRDVHLRLEPGETLGLVGENGAGKSTLVKLLLGLYAPTDGRITYGGVDLRDLDPRDLRSRFGAVFQDFVRYQFTAGENIGLGDPSRVDDRERVAEAARRAGAGPLVDALPNGLDTVLGGWFEKGHDLSAGQWQKLAVARAFMRDAEVLVLDEPTAAIDAEAEHELFVRFRELAAGRSALVISHRFSTVRMADRIAVLHGGRVVELGSHRELLARGGRYAHLFSLQAQGYLD